MKVVFQGLLVNAQYLLEKYTYLDLIIIKIIIYLRKLDSPFSLYFNSITNYREKPDRISY
ncbi:hypothetical protein C7B06_24165 [Escherichia coli]|nr:hypothetical protein C7B06_24165 [Escherichia coli]PSZ11975.1 hypothetical protein C7B07_23950 [Escherichia coli]